MGGSPPRRVSEEPFTLTAPPSPDGRWLAGLDGARMPVLVSVADGTRRPLAGLEAEDTPVQWTRDGRALWVSQNAPAEEGLAKDLLRTEYRLDQLFLLEGLR